MPVTLNGEYELGRTLGRGVSCKVKIARDRQGNRYAIKIMHRNEDASEFLETEYDALTQIPQHRNIVRLHEVGRGYQVHPKKGKKLVEYFVLELIGGGELFDLIALGGGLTEPQARHMFHELLAGLQNMHLHGFAHRDLKPENILLSSDFVLKLTDFGFSAPLAGRDGSGMLKTQVGTLSFMAPEQHLGMSYEGAKVDIFAAGIILFTTIAQRPPFHAARRGDQLFCILAKKQYEVFWRLHAEAEDEGRDIFSPEFKDLFQRMVSLDAAKRPTIDEILKHPWMQGPRIDEASWQADFCRRKAVVDAESRRDREQKLEARQQSTAPTTGESTVYRSLNLQKDEASQQSGDGARNSLEEGWLNLSISSYGPLFQFSNTQFFTTCEPLAYFSAFTKTLSAQGKDFRVSDDKLKLKYQDTLSKDGKTVEVHMEVLRVNHSTCCIKFGYRDLQSKTDLYDCDAVKHFLAIRGNGELRVFCDATFEGQEEESSLSEQPLEQTV